MCPPLQDLIKYQSSDFTTESALPDFISAPVQILKGPQTGARAVVCVFATTGDKQKQAKVSADAQIKLCASANQTR